VTIDRTDGGARVALTGKLRLAEVAGGVSERMAELHGPGEIVVDASGVDGLDTAGAWAIATLRDRLKAEGAEVRIEGLGPDQAALLETVERALPKEEPPAEPRGGFAAGLEGLGESVVETWRAIVEMLNLLGAVLARIAGYAVRPGQMRFTSLVYHMQQAGLNALPIASLMAFLIGVVLAFMGAVQLQQFGAEIFVVDLIAIAVLRELGILLTAIIVAGRSASAFTASIGSMKMREEIDAMRTLGLDPIEILVVPRVLALVITLPLLGVMANFAGLIGGATMAWIELGVSPSMFVVRLFDQIGVWHYLVGIIKAPFFALVIGLIGCQHGLQVGGNAESLGKLTSASVVAALFMVIVIDAIFAIFFALVNI
jgi:phospholipid/cholesterol/gamma-HCH transport system permease protein